MSGFLCKAVMQRVDRDGRLSGDPLEVMFNPGELVFSKANQIAEIAIPGLDTPILQFVRGQTETLAVDLFFDSTEEGTGDGAKPVTLATDAFYQLIKIESETHAPPVVVFSWGGDAFPGHRSHPNLSSQARHGFKGVVESIRQRFTFFSSTGVPLRATLSLQLKEYKTLAEQLAELHLQSPDRPKAHVVREGETITRIAAVAGENPRDWRRIAEANGIDDPFSLEPGRVLAIPAIGQG